MFQYVWQKFDKIDKPKAEKVFLKIWEKAKNILLEHGHELTFNSNILLSNS